MEFKRIGLTLNDVRVIEYEGRTGERVTYYTRRLSQCSILGPMVRTIQQGKSKCNLGSPKQWSYRFYTVFKQLSRRKEYFDGTLSRKIKNRSDNVVRGVKVKMSEGKIRSSSVLLKTLSFILVQ